MSSLVSKTEGSEVKLYSLDDYFSDKEKPSIIKADIEGSELNMLQGAKEIITDYKPKFALSLYHNPSDIVLMPELIKQFNNGYNFAVRTHSPNFEDTLLYCY